MNTTLRPLAWKSKAALGGSPRETATNLLFELEPAAFLAVSVTLKVPGWAYVCSGLRAVLEVPSPKSQIHESGSPSDLSVKRTRRPSAWKSNSAFGASPSEGLTNLLAVAEMPNSLRMVSLTA